MKKIRAYQVFYVLAILLAIAFAAAIVISYLGYRELRSNPLVLMAPFSSMAARLCLMLLTPAGVCAIAGYYLRK